MQNPVPVQRPWIEWAARVLWQRHHAAQVKHSWVKQISSTTAYLYGDYRTGIASGRNATATFNNWASRLNLDLDYRKHPPSDFMRSLAR